MQQDKGLPWVRLVNKFWLLNTHQSNHKLVEGPLTCLADNQPNVISYYQQYMITNNSHAYSHKGSILNWCVLKNNVHIVKIINVKILKLFI